MTEKSHYIPCSFLSAFASKDSRDGMVYVFDKKNRKVFTQICENVGWNWKYYTVAINGVSPDYVEVEFGKIEGLCKQIVRKIERDKKMVVGEDYVSLMYYFGLLSERVPVTRKRFVDQVDKIGKALLVSSVIDKTPEEILKIMNRNNEKQRTVLDAIEMKNNILTANYTLSANNTYQVDSLLKTAKIVAATLVQRKWTVLYRTENQDAYFACGDAPVMLLWQATNPVIISQPGFAHEKTEVVIPITKNIAIVGRFQEALAGDSCRAKSANIRMINRFSIEHSERFIFNFTNSIPIVLPNLTRMDYSF